MQYIGQFFFNLEHTEVTSEPYQTSKMEIFLELVNEFQPLNHSTNSSRLDVT